MKKENISLEQAEKIARDRGVPQSKIDEVIQKNNKIKAKTP